MKKIFVLILVLLLLMSICGCAETIDDKIASDTTESDLTSEIPVESSSEDNEFNDENVNKNNFKRLKSVTFFSKSSNGTTESRTHEINWNGNICTFPMAEYGFVEMGLDADTNELYIHRLSEDTEESVVDREILCTFDDIGRVVSYDVTSFGSELPDVEYDENGWPEGDYLELFNMKVDPAKMKYSYPWSGVAGEDSASTNYNIVTIDKFGNVVKSDNLSVTTYNDTGETEEELYENVQRYTYDSSGNLIKFEWLGAVVEYTYTDETIHHQWERAVPILCYNYSFFYIMPIFWNLK